jgi:hypothetical protein
MLIVAAPFILHDRYRFREATFPRVDLTYIVGKSRPEATLRRAHPIT